MPLIKHVRQHPKRAGRGLKARIRTGWRTTIWSSAWRAAAARTRARELGRSLARLGLPHSDISLVTPALARSFAEAERQRVRRLRLAMPLIIIFTMPLWVSGFGHSLFFPANLFLPEPDEKAKMLAAFLYLLVFFAFLFVSAEFQIRGVESQRLVKYGPAAVRASARLQRISRWLLAPFLAVHVATFGPVLHHAWSHPDVSWVAMASAGVATLWSRDQCPLYGAERTLSECIATSQFGRAASAVAVNPRIVQRSICRKELASQSSGGSDDQSCFKH
jgi:hypothetical protein